MPLVGEAIVQAEIRGIKRKVELLVAKETAHHCLAEIEFKFSMEIIGQEDSHKSTC